MSKYEAPVRDMRFVLFDVLGVEPIYQRLGYEAATRDVIEAVLDEAERLLEAEDPERIALFGGGFSKNVLITLCREENVAYGI